MYYFFGILFLVSAFHIYDKVEGNATLFVALLKYDNPNSEKVDGTCCDGVAQNRVCTTDLCDLSFKICVKINATRNPCQTINLQVDRPPQLQIDSPKEFPEINVWKGETPVVVTVTDEDPQGEELVDQFIFNYTEKDPIPSFGQLQKSDYKTLTLNGTRRKPSTLTVQLAVKCQSNYYSKNCAVFCIPTVDCSGHYVCDQSTGRKICDKGWEGEGCTKPKIGEFSCPAQSKGCENGGTCSKNKFSNSTDNFFCCCPPGFTGSRCETDINECDQKPCQHGVCQNFNGSYACNCDYRYDGKNCELKRTCKSKPCRNNATCTHSNGTFMCICGSGYSGIQCENEISTTTTSTTPSTTVSTTTSTTKSSTTEISTSTITKISTVSPSSSTTQQVATTTSKTSLSSSTGNTDTTQVTSKHTSMPPAKIQYACPENYCRHNSACVDGKCNCASGFTGVLCQIEIIECKNDSCLNGGFCNDFYGRTSCDCVNGYKGSRCEIPPPALPTQSNTNACAACSNGSCYVSSNGSASCVCNPGFRGKTCAHSRSLCHSYVDALCFKRDQCLLKTIRGSIEHACPKDWDGPLCRNASIPSSRDKECPRVVCKNDGHCFDGKCCCREGYVGEFCEKEKLYCDTLPCRNNATCINVFRGYKCKCPVGFSGKECENYVLSTKLVSTPAKAVQSSTKEQTTHATVDGSSSSSPFTVSTDILTSESTAETAVTESQPSTASASSSTTTIKTPTTPSIVRTSQSMSLTASSTTATTTQTSPSTVYTTQRTPSTPFPTIPTDTSTSPSKVYTTPSTFLVPSSTTSTKTLTSPSILHTISSTIKSTTMAVSSPYIRCTGVQKFLNGTSIDTSFGSTDCTCMKTVDFIVVAFCTFVEPALKSSTIDVFSLTSSSFQTSTNRMSTEDLSTLGTKTTIPTITTTSSTSLPTSQEHTTRTTKSTTTSTENHESASTFTQLTTMRTPLQSKNNSILLSGKIQSKDTEEFGNIISNALRNTSLGKNCTNVDVIKANYLYSISGNVFTKVLYNSSDCPDVSSTDTNPNLTASINNQLTKSPFKSHTIANQDTYSLGKSHQVPMIGYVYSANRDRIKGIIKRTWTIAGNNDVDVLIVDASYCIGEYGMYVTDISYLVTSGLKFLRPKKENVPQLDNLNNEFKKQTSAGINQIYMGNILYRYDQGMRLSLLNIKRAKLKSLMDIYNTALAKWTNFAKGRQICHVSKCDIGMTVSPLEQTSSLKSAGDIVFFPTINEKLPETTKIRNALPKEISGALDTCDNCTSARDHFVDVKDRVKLKDEHRIQQAMGSNSRYWRKTLFIQSQSQLVTRIYYTPRLPNDSKTEWPHPDLEGNLYGINKSLNSVNKMLVTSTVQKLHTIILKGVISRSVENQVNQALIDTWSASNKHIKKERMKIYIIKWSDDFVSEMGERVTKISYTLSVLDGDSSIVALSSPKYQISKDIFSHILIEPCDCTARKIRTLWLKDIYGSNLTIISDSVTNAWTRSNSELNLQIPTFLIKYLRGYQSAQGERAVNVTYYVTPKRNGQYVDEDDLDEPSSLLIEQQLKRQSTDSHVYNTATKVPTSASEETNWWIYLLIALGACVLIALLSAIVITKVRESSHSQSRTLKQNPKDIDGYDKEHFSKEPVMEKNSNGLYTVEDEDTDYTKTTYIVNSSYNNVSD